jgi:toxin-antitoxin system PIN domain toxin
LIALPDVNVLVALAWANHPHHNAAHVWFAVEAANGWATCVLTQSGFLRLSLNPHVVGVSIGCSAARSLLDGLVSHPQHRFVEQLPSLSGATFNDLVPRIMGHGQVSDAVLLHIARSHGMKVVTLDQATAALSPWPQNIETIQP